MEKELGSTNLSNIERLLGATAYWLRKFQDLPNTPDNERLKSHSWEEYQISLKQLMEAINA